MKSIHRLVIACLVLLVFTNFSTHESQPISSQLDNSVVNKSLKGHFVPIKGSFSVTAATTGPGSYDYYVKGTGNVSHLGLTTFKLGNSFDYSVPLPWPATGKIEFKAANGDQLYGSFSGTVDINSQGIFIISYNGSFNGGTGRFAEATGNFHWKGTFNGLTGTGQLRGSINY